MKSLAPAPDGFTVLEVCLLVAAVALAGFAGLREYQNAHRATVATIQHPDQFPAAKNLQTTTQNGQTTIYISRSDNGKTITAHIGDQIIFQLSPSLTWYYGITTTSTSGEDPLAENSNGNYLAQSPGVDDITATGTSGPIKCPSNADCWPSQTSGQSNGQSTLAVHVEVVK